jgi:hypothetical protein
MRLPSLGKAAPLVVAWVALTAALQRPPPAGDLVPFTSWAQLALFAIAVGAVVKWVFDLWKLKRNGPAPKPDFALPMLQRLEVALLAQTTTLAALQATQLLLVERLGNLATKLDLNEVATKAQQAYRTALYEALQSLRKGSSP